MKLELDTIKFESRYEVGEILKAVYKYMEQNPKEKKNEVLKEFYHLLDVMEMSW